MKFDILVLADFHWDALDAVKQYDETAWVLSFIEKVPHLDLVVIAGDYFDAKMLLNSKASIYSIKWMCQLIQICNKRNIKIRIVRGTISHDNNQLNAFDSYDDGDNFRIIRECTAEETLPGFNCLYCPDETIPTNDYMDKYAGILYGHQYDAMFFHGSFDVVVPNIAIQESESSGFNNVIFKYNFFKNICRVMIGGHWHDGDQNEHMYYTRSLNRWRFNEDNPKGFIYVTYDTDDKTYNLQRIENPFTEKYRTLHVNTRIFKSIEEYEGVIEDTHVMLSDDPTCHVRIKITVDDEKPINENGINALKHKFMNEKRVKIELKNALKDKKKKEDRRKNELIKSEFAFVQDRSKTPSEIIQEFILHQKGRAIPIDVIDKFILKYLH